MKRFILAIVCMVAIAAPFMSQDPQGKLAGLIQSGNRKAALDMIAAGADVNEAQPDGTRPIHWAVYRVDYELMEALIAKKAKADVTNELGATPLTEAVKLSDARLVKMLLDAGSGPEGANEDGQTALMLAIKNGDLPIVQMLVDAGAKVNVAEKVQNQTPLMWAAAATRNAPEMVKLLLSKGADVKVRAKYSDWPSQITSEPRAQYHAVGGLTPLLYAARSGCQSCVEALLAAGADINLPTPEGVTPLMVALDNSHNEVAKFLMDRGANPKLWDIYGRTALYIAVDKKTAAAAGGAGGGGGGGRGGAGAAPAPAGAGRGAAGAPGQAPGRGAGAPAAAPAAAAVQAPGQAAGQAQGRGAAGAPAAAAGQGAGGRGAGAGAGAGAGGGGARGAGGAGAQGGGRGGLAPNIVAVSSMDIINALLAANVDVNAQLNMRRPSNQGGRFNDPLLSSGTTPLFRAVMNNDMEVIRALLAKGANPNIYGMGTTAWLMAAGANSYGGRGGGGGAAFNKELLDLLIEHGADVSSQVKGTRTYSMRISRSLSQAEGQSALHAAVAANSTDLVKYLLEHGARTDVVDASGRTPLDVANAVPAKPVPPSLGNAIPTTETDPATTNAVPAGGRGGAGARGASPEVKALLQNPTPVPAR